MVDFVNKVLGELSSIIGRKQYEDLERYVKRIEESAQKCDLETVLAYSRMLGSVIDRIRKNRDSEFVNLRLAELQVALDTKLNRIFSENCKCKLKEVPEVYSSYE